MLNPEEKEMIGEPDPEDIGIFELMRGLKQYELSNHLGNVLSVVTDQKLTVDDNGTISYFTAEVISYSDYYPFGSSV